MSSADLLSRRDAAKTDLSALHEGYLGEPLPPESVEAWERLVAEIEWIDRQLRSKP